MPEFKTEFIRVKSREEAPDDCVTNLTRPNLFGCFYTEYNGEIVRDPGLLESENELNIFVYCINPGLVELFTEKSLEFNYMYGQLFFQRNADVKIYYIRSAKSI